MCENANKDATYTRKKACTDYARATGSCVRGGHITYWTRSPWSQNRMDVWVGKVDGSLDTERPYSYNCVCPCIYISAE